MGTQNHLRVALVIGLVSVFAHAPIAAAQTPPRLDVTVRSSPKDRLTLEVSVTLRGDSPVQTSEFELPWGSTQSLVLMAGQLPGGWPVPRAVQQIEDPAPVYFTLQPGRTVTGTIDLRERFPDLVKTLRDADVIVFWSYKLRGLLGKAVWESERTADSLVLERSTRKRR